MITIHKYVLEIAENQVVEMPSRAKIIKAGEQNGNLCIWAIIDTDRRPANKHIGIVGTGNPADADLVDAIHIDTVQMSSGLVWHVFSF